MNSGIRYFLPSYQGNKMKRIKEQIKRNRKGLVLVLTASLIVFLAVLGVGLLQLGLGARVQAARNAAQIAAYAAADSGLTEAVYRMQHTLEAAKSEGEDWDNSWIPYQSSATTLDNARFNFDINGNQATGFEITSTGRSGIAEKTVKCRIKVRSVWFGIGVKDTLVAKVGAQFGTIPANGDFSIRTNSTNAGAILLNNGVQIPGDVIVGPGGVIDISDPDCVVDLKLGAAVTGEIYSAPELFFPEVTVPDGLTDWGTKIEAKGETIEIGEAQSGIYTGLRLLETSEPGILKITDPNVVLYFTGDVDIGTKCELIVEDGASLTIYLGADMTTGEATAITNNNIIDPDTATDEELAEGTLALKIYGLDTCEDITIKTKSDLFGAIYAREADLLLGNEGDIYGAFVGNSMNINNGGGFLYYVNALSHINIDEETAYFSIERWWE